MPRFPFRRSVGEDLRDLFTHDRLRARANDLGYSSLSPGEGSAEVRDAGGNTLAHYGHHAGKSGFLVPDGAGWQTVQEATAAAVAAGTASLSSRMTTAEGRLDSHALRIGAAENDIVDLNQTKVEQSVHNVLAGRVGAAENDITDLQNTKVGFSIYNVLAGRVGAAENDIATNNGLIDTNKQTITNIGTELDNLKAYVFSIHGGPAG